MAEIIKIKDGRSAFSAGDDDRYLLLEGFGSDVVQVQYEDIKGSETLDVNVEAQADGTYTCLVPNQLLTGEYEEILCYVVGEDDKGQYTIKSGRFPITKRQTSGGYVVDPLRLVTWNDIIAEATRAKEAAATSAEEAASSAQQADEILGNALKTDESIKTTASEVARDAGETESNRQTVETAIENFNGASQKLYADMQTEHQDAIDDIAAQETAALASIGSSKTAAITALEEKKSAAIKEMESETEKDKGAISTAQSNALTAIDNAKTKAVGDVESTGTTQTEKVRQQGETSKGEVTAAQSAALTALDEKKTSSLTALGDKETSALAEIQKKVDAASQSASDAAGSADEAAKSATAAAGSAREATTRKSECDTLKAAIDTIKADMEDEIYLQSESHTYKRVVSIRRGRCWSTITRIA